MRLYVRYDFCWVSSSVLARTLTTENFPNSLDR